MTAGGLREGCGMRRDGLRECLETHQKSEAQFASRIIGGRYYRPKRNEVLLHLLALKGVEFFAALDEDLAVAEDLGRL